MFDCRWVLLTQNVSSNCRNDFEVFLYLPWQESICLPDWTCICLNLRGWVQIMNNNQNKAKFCVTLSPVCGHVDHHCVLCAVQIKACWSSRLPTRPSVQRDTAKRRWWSKWHVSTALFLSLKCSLQVRVACEYSHVSWLSNCTLLIKVACEYSLVSL